MPPKRPAKEEPSDYELLNRFCESYKRLRASVDTATAKDNKITQLRERNEFLEGELKEANMREESLRRDSEEAERSG
ncbi:hypothetical protein B5807_09190 [Epicoccum nigrum]|uniref:Uncharacterized protein n=1 Tax=Epicoccum nigrum TaxID=105696 RepID=A0A1Y2LM63_EPING|nr:hypothetical protein B5807_09190 [Epicoccum nigrum]